MSVDTQYKNLLQEVIHNGERVSSRAGVTRQIFGWDFRFDLQKEFPALSLKKTAVKTAIKELLWIYQDQSNDVGLLRSKYGVKVWDEWESDKTKIVRTEKFPYFAIIKKGTIGEAYGAQVRKHNQIDKLIEGIKKDPYSRRHVMTLWETSHLSAMMLQPCAFMTIWQVTTDGRLNMHLIQRSGDIGLGVPFNMVQYATLQTMVAQVTGLKPGIFWHTITNPHIYYDHLKPVSCMLDREPLEGNNPVLQVSPEVTDFYDFTPDDFQITQYEPHPHIRMEVNV